MKPVEEMHSNNFKTDKYFQAKEQKHALFKTGNKARLVSVKQSENAPKATQAQEYGITNGENNFSTKITNFDEVKKVTAVLTKKSDGKPILSQRDNIALWIVNNGQTQPGTRSINQ
jgi:hypothetical protein